MIKPILNNVLVKPFEADNISSGGIIVSDAHKEVSNKVKIIAVGKGTKKYPMNFNVGDTAFRVKNSGTEIIIKGETHYIVQSTWLIAKLN